MCRCVAASTDWAMVSAVIRRHMVARSPATVNDTIRFIVSRTNAPTVVVSVSAIR